MRTRSKGEPFIAGHTHTGITTFRWTNPAFNDFESYFVGTHSGLSYPALVSTITDEESITREQVYVDPVTKKWRRFKRPPRAQADELDLSYGSAGLFAHQIPPVKKCHHVSQRYLFCKDQVVVHERVNSPGNPLNERTDTRTLNFKDGLQILDTLFPGDPALSLDNPSAPSGDYVNHDWFGLMDQFTEACDQFIPSSTMLGETLFEGGIFLDAIKIVVNPSNAIKLLIREGLKLGKHVRRMNLGHAFHHLSKKSTNAALFYQFGVRPAISDIITAIEAHKKVSDRLKYLRNNAGRFVPVRVKKVLPSTYDSTPPPVDLNISQYCEWVTTEKSSTARIGGWGRVREDFNFSNDWAAYLQYFGINKVVGLAWELIPFSFVVDWFTNIQERINHMTRLQTGGPFVEIRNISSSVKQLHKQELFLVPGRDSSFAAAMSFPVSPTSIVTYMDTIYDRMPGIPDTSGVLDISALGLFHAVTGAGLIIQRT